MSNKSQLNQLSKREILESLLQRQQQESSTLNRLVIAVAMAAGLEPEAVAAKFADSTASANFVERFNKALDEEFSKREQQAKNPREESEVLSEKQE